MSIRLVIAEDHTVVLQGLQALLAFEDDMEVVAACREGEEAIEAVGLYQPDVLVMDVFMPRCGGLEALEQLKAKGASMPTVLLTATMDDATLISCIELGVQGIVLKEAAASVLVEAIRAVAQGESWIPPMLSNRALALLSRRPGREANALTDREKEIAVLVAGGKSNKKVAAELGIAESTVKLHLHNAFNKLEVRNRVQLSLLVRERGWI